MTTTNADLNRAVAVLRGLTQCQCDPHCGFWYTAAGESQTLPDYCTDPAAWGGLFVALAGELPKGYPSLQWFGSFWGSSINVSEDNHVTGYDDALPGRALCLALIAASREGEQK